MKTNTQKGSKISIIIFCNGIERKNYPSIYIVENIQKMCLSFSTLNYIDIQNIEIALFLPDLLFKMYYQFLKFYINNSIINQIKIYESYEEINADYSLFLDEDIESRIDRCLLLNTNFFENINEIKQNGNSSLFKRNYFSK